MYFLYGYWTIEMTFFGAYILKQLVMVEVVILNGSISQCKGFSKELRCVRTPTTSIFLKSRY
jgi:hypothetical protein